MGSRGEAVSALKELLKQRWASGEQSVVFIQEQEVQQQVSRALRLS